MITRRRRPVAHEEADEHPDERWMASYMDMVTVLMCLFIVLFAMSTVDQEKYEQLRNSLATGFGVVEAGAVDTAEGVVVPPELVDDTDEGFSDVALALQEIDELRELQERIRLGLVERGLEQSVAFQIDERGLTVRLVGSQTFFAPNSDALSDEALAVLGTIAPVLVDTGRETSVEGHADFHGNPAPYPSDWELSSARATSVLRNLVEAGGVASDRIGAVGYGSARPLSTGPTEQDFAMNRRVDIAVLSDESDDVRALIPELLEGGSP